MRSFLLSLVCLSSPLLAEAESRSWKSANGAGTFTGSYVSHDEGNVTIRRADGKLFTLELTKLSADDRAWIAAQAAVDEDPLPPSHAVFDSLCFGDSMDDVKKKLKASKAVETTLEETYIARTGLNGVYRTRQKIGGLHCELFFDWAPGQKLSEIMLQTQGQKVDAYDSSLKSTWSELVELLTTMHGRPVQGGGFPASKQLKDDVFLPSHLWRLADGGSALLGMSMQAGHYLVVVRFTEEKVEPARAPGP